MLDSDLVYRIVDTTPQVFHLEWGALVKQILDGVQGFLTIVVCGVVAKVAPVAIRQFLTNEVLKNAVAYAIATTEGAVAGQAIDIKLMNGLIGQAEAYCLANAPRLVKALDDTLRPKLIARLGQAGVIPADYKGG